MRCTQASKSHISAAHHSASHLHGCLPQVTVSVFHNTVQVRSHPVTFPTVVTGIPSPATHHTHHHAASHSSPLFHFFLHSDSFQFLLMSGSGRLKGRVCGVRTLPCTPAESCPLLSRGYCTGAGGDGDGSGLVILMTAKNNPEISIK